MPNDKKLPAPIPTTLPQAQSSGLVARGLLAVRQSLAVADKNDAEALFKKGIRYFTTRRYNYLAPSDYDKARPYLLAAAKLNHAEAQFELYGLLQIEDELPEAAAWLEKSVSLGFGPAQAELAECLSDPSRGIADHLTERYDESELYAQSSVWYEQHASAGDAIAQYEFARILRHSGKPIYDSEKAMRWIKAAAEQDHLYACRDLGEWLLDYKTPQHNTEQGIYWLSQAAKLGDFWACKSLGDLYLFGHARSRLARGGFAKLVTPDKRLAVLWYERDAELRKKLGSFGGLHSLGCLYLVGDHLDQNLALAERMLSEAANGGDLSSQRSLAAEYTSGKRLKRDTAAALQWLRMAEQNDHGTTRIDQHQLGYFYEHEADDAPNYFEALQWYRKAADEGYYKSQKSLGHLYESGKGVPMDYVLACKWYLLSAANSYGYLGIVDFHTGALRSLDVLVKKMSASQRAEATKLAEGWMDETNSMDAKKLDLAREGLKRAS